MNKSEVFSPAELQLVVIAALLEIARHPQNYRLATAAAVRLYRWLISTIWDNQYEPTIKIEEVPF